MSAEVIFTSDNGPTTHGQAGPLLGGKNRIWEGGIRVPTVMWWPGTIAAGRISDERMMTMDLMPTMMALNGIDPGPLQFDGVDLSAHITEAASLPSRFLYFNYHGINDTVYQLGIIDDDNRKWAQNVSNPDLAGDGIFDLDADLGETTNLVMDLLDLNDTRRAEMQAWLESVGVFGYEMSPPPGEPAPNQTPPAPEDADPSTSVLQLPLEAGAGVGLQLSSVDPDGDSVQYSLLADAGGRFTVDVNTGVVTAARDLSATDQGEYSVRTQASDGQDVSASVDFPVTLYVDQDLGLQAQAVSYEEILLQWQPAPLADWYLVHRRDGEQLNRLTLRLVTEAGQTSCRDDHLQPASDYSYTVQAGHQQEH
ncbi:MAG: sulfatase-like hydrolase/transferase [Planctomycetota bacterium]